MYPFLRLANNVRLGAVQSPLGLTDTHVSHHMIWPWDLDMFGELNNGLTLTIYDLGRFGLAQRGGLIKTLRTQKWALAMAGASVRYRRRLTLFERFEMRSRAVCWDERFIYLEQSIWKRNSECASHILYRAAVIDKNGAVAPERVLEAMGLQGQSPRPPDWITAWIAAEATRPWPPMQDI